MSLTLIEKYVTDAKIEYIEFDQDGNQHILNRHIKNSAVMETEAWDYIETSEELVNAIMIQMDNETSLYIVPAKQVIDSPYNTGYFIY